jgi:hypothetical protein
MWQPPAPVCVKGISKRPDPWPLQISLFDKDSALPLPGSLAATAMYFSEAAIAPDQWTFAVATVFVHKPTSFRLKF